MSKKYFSFCLFLLFFTFAFGQNYSMMIRSASVKRIYRQCENPLYFDVSNLCGEEYNPKVVATNADVKKDSASLNKFIIFPKEGKACLLALYNQKNEEEVKLGEEKVVVIDPPKPDLMVKVNGVAYSPEMRVGRGSRVTITILPDMDFANALPKEAIYGIDEVSIYRGMSKVGGHGIYMSKNMAQKGMDIPIPSECFVRSGDKIYIELKNIYRFSSNGTSVMDNRFSVLERTIVLTSN